MSCVATQLAEMDTQANAFKGYLGMQHGFVRPAHKVVRAAAQTVTKPQIQKCMLRRACRLLALCLARYLHCPQRHQATTISHMVGQLEPASCSGSSQSEVCILLLHWHSCMLLTLSRQMRLASAWPLAGNWHLEVKQCRSALVQAACCQWSHDLSRRIWARCLAARKARKQADT